MLLFTREVARLLSDLHRCSVFYMIQTAAICLTCLPPEPVEVVTYAYPGSTLMVIGAALFAAGLLVLGQ